VRLGKQLLEAAQLLDAVLRAVVPERHVDDRGAGGEPGLHRGAGFVRAVARIQPWAFQDDIKGAGKPHAAEQLVQCVRGEPERHPPIPEVHRPAQRACRRSPDPDRHVRAPAVRVNGQARVVVVSAVVLGHRPSPAGPQGGQRVVGPCSAVGESRPEQLELLPQGADAEAEDQPAVAEPVERPVTLRYAQRMVVAEDQHVRGQPDPLRLGGQERQRGQRIPVRAAAASGRRGRDHDVLAARQVVIAKAVRGLGHGHDVRDVAVLFPRVGLPGRPEDHRRQQPEPHRCLPGRGHWAPKPPSTG
jgi:hypothetical protein